VFILNYIAVVPTSNMLGFCGQSLARKLPKVVGIVVETTLASTVEIILVMVLLRKNNVPVIQAAILGSVLANLLLCLGACFFVGGLRRHSQDFDENVSEVGSNLLLVAGFGLLIPAAFYEALRSQGQSEAFLAETTLKISRATAVILLIAYLLFLFFQLHTHHSLLAIVLESDEEKDADHQKESKRRQLTLVESLVGTIFALATGTLVTIFLVEEIEPISKYRHISDNFMGLIMVPFISKAAEHIMAVDEAWDNQMNFALSHVLGSTVATALFVAPLVVIVGWIIDVPMDLRFEIFMIVLLILSIIIVGNLLRDGKSNYLEGCMAMLTYIIITVTTWYYPSTTEQSNGEEASATTTAVAATATAVATEVVRRLIS
jgi:Ca2+:H+ antiporter